MMKVFEIIVRENEMVSALIDGKETSLREVIGIIAFSVYEKTIEISKEENADQKKRLEEKISFQSKILDSLSNAYMAIK